MQTADATPPGPTGPPAILRCADLAGLRASVAEEEFGPLGPHALLLLALDAGGASAEDTAWLRRLQCPVVGIGDGDHPAAAACDTVIESRAALGPIVRQVAQSPRAASVLVQTLRATEHLPLHDALAVESLAFGNLQAGPEFRRWLAAQPAAGPTAADAGPAVRVERHGNRLWLTLNRPSSRNAISVELRDALSSALDLVLLDPTIEQVEISGSGPGFSAGGHLAEFGHAADANTAHHVRMARMPATRLIRCAARVRCRLHGACVGSGIEIPAFAGQVSCAAGSWFQLPELRFGLIPGAGGCVSIARRIGRQRTARMALSGERVDHEQALAWGLVDRIGDD